MSPLRSILSIATAAFGLSSLTAAQSNSSTSGSGLTVGTSRIDITPAINKNWYSLNEFELEKLHVRAIYYETGDVRGAFINVEVADIQAPAYLATSDAVAAFLNTPKEYVVISYTHTHGAAPDGTGLGFLGANYGNGALNGYASLADAAVEAVSLAMNNTQKAKVGYNTGEAYLNVNRDYLNPDTGRWTQASNFSGPVDRSVQVLTFNNLNNTPIAILSSYAMHPVNSYMGGFVSADWPGAMARWIENNFDDNMVAVMTQQASGDVNPKHRRCAANHMASIGHMPITGFEMTQEPIEEPIRDYLTPMDRPDTHYTRQLFTELTAIGVVMGEEVLQIASLTTEWNENPTVWAKQQNATCPGRTRLDSAREGVPGVYTTGPDVDIPTGLLGFGDIAIATVGAEIFTRIGLRIKDESPFNKTMLMTMSNGKAASGYIPDALSWDHETFQVLGSKLMPGSCPELNISSAITSLANEYQSYLG